MCVYICICIYIYPREFKSSFLRLHWESLIPTDMLNLKSLPPSPPHLPPFPLMQRHIFATPNFEMFKHVSFGWVFLLDVFLGMQVYKHMCLCSSTCVLGHEYWCGRMQSCRCLHKQASAWISVLHFLVAWDMKKDAVFSEEDLIFALSAVSLGEESRCSNAPLVLC